MRGSKTSDVALVEGSFAPRENAGGSLATLCQWLNLPRLAMSDVRLLGGCCLPARPEGIDALLLDGVESVAEACRWQTHFEAIWNVPVLGWMPAVGKLREQIRQLPAGVNPQSNCVTSWAASLPVARSGNGCAVSSRPGRCRNASVPLASCRNAA